MNQMNRMIRYFHDRWIGKNRRSKENDFKRTCSNSEKPDGDTQKGFGFSE